MIFKKTHLLPFLLSPLGLLIAIAPRSGPLLVLLLGLAGIIHYIRHRPPLNWLNTPATYLLLVFLAYLFLTSLWSMTPERSMEQAFRWSILTFFGLAAFSLVRSLRVAQKKRVMECLLPALFVGIISGCIFGLLQYTGSYIRTIEELFMSGSDFSNFDTNNRRHIAKSLLLTNLAFFAILPWLWQKQKMVAVAAFLALCAVCFHSDSQSSFVTCVIGGVVFLLVKFNSNWGTRAIVTGIIASFLIVVPLIQSPAVTLLQEKVPTASKNKTSFETRIDIYEFFADEILNRPLLGHGLEAGVKVTDLNIDSGDIPRNIATPHSIHLQILFDIGYVGAILLLAAILSPFRQIFNNASQQPAPILLLPICVTIAAASFNFVFWRTWIPSATILSLLFVFLYSQEARQDDDI